jgi:hypothetical protein
MIDEHFALHARSFVNFALHARSLFERTLHSMPGFYLNFALHAKSFSRLCTPCQEFTFYEKCVLHVRSFNDFTKYSNHIKALTPGMEFKSELFHPTKIKIELTSFENFVNELFTIFIKKTLTHLN